MTTPTPTTSSSTRTIVKFVPFQSTAEPSFWMKLGEHKLDTLRLDERAVRISASYGVVPVAGTTRGGDGGGNSSSTGTVISAGRMRFDQDSIELEKKEEQSDNNNDDDDHHQAAAALASSSSSNNERITSDGHVVVLNTIESFKKVDKNRMLEDHCLSSILRACGIQNDDNKGREEEEEEEEESLKGLTTFFCLSHLDLKSHKIIYWFAFPALMPSPGKAICYDASTGGKEQRLLRDVWGDERMRRLADAFHRMRVERILQKEEEQSRVLSSRRRKRKVRGNDDDDGGGCPPFFMVILSSKTSSTTNLTAKPTKNSLKTLRCIPLSQRAYRNLSVEEKKDCTFAFLDPSITTTRATTTSDSPPPPSPVGWTLRNLVAYLTLRLKLDDQNVVIISYRPGLVRRIPTNDLTTIRGGEDITNDTSLLLRIRLPSSDDYLWPVKTTETETNTNTNTPASTTTTTSNPPKTHKYTLAGWELNNRGRNGPRTLNLSPLLSPSHLVTQATSLNLRLMKWRQIPNLNLQALSQTKALLLGAGTLGCNVARTLLGWGIRHITFVDNGRVSYSNPVRQSLFTVDDCSGGGKLKAVAAAESLRHIAGEEGVRGEGVVLTIPMPGHGWVGGSKEEAEAKDAVETLHRLFEEHDVVFLLTDTRESRWLPSVISRVTGTVLIDAALGLDGWLVMRHGLSGGIGGAGGGGTEERLGCYFCNDIVAPENSMRDRTLDQQCTVTRPGLAPIASAMAVELMVALLHCDGGFIGRKGVDARAPPPALGYGGGGGGREFSPIVNTSDKRMDVSPLGIMPHQIRGSVVSYTMMTPTVPAFRCCTGCCDAVVEAYRREKFYFVNKVCCCPDGSFLENLSGLTKFREEADKKMEDIDDWEEDDESGEDF